MMDAPTDWDRRLFDLARYVSRWSKDPTTKVGAVVVGLDRRNIALGYNGFPPGVQDKLSRLNDREVKHFLTQHAERNVLDNAQFPLDGASLFVTFYPCPECAKSIVSKRIARVVTPPPSQREPWAGRSQISKLILDEGGVYVQEVNWYGETV